MYLHIYVCIYRHIQHTINQDAIHQEQDDMLLEDHATSHETVAIENMDPDTNQKHINRYNCQYEGCSRTYSTIGNLRTHVKTHKGKILKYNFFRQKIIICIYSFVFFNNKCDKSEYKTFTIK